MHTSLTHTSLLGPYYHPYLRHAKPSSSMYDNRLKEHIEYLMLIKQLKQYSLDHDTSLTPKIFRAGLTYDEHTYMKGYEN
jgi:hypothetical protein